MTPATTLHESQTTDENQAAKLDRDQRQHESPSEGGGLCQMAHWIWELPIDRQFKSNCVICLQECEDRAILETCRREYISRWACYLWLIEQANPILLT